jgi:hypothetical protein
MVGATLGAIRLYTNQNSHLVLNTLLYNNCISSLNSLLRPQNMHLIKRSHKVNDIFCVVIKYYFHYKSIFENTDYLRNHYYFPRSVRK